MTRLRPSDERGFTVIELTIVLIMIAILIGIAIPTFLGVRDRGYDTAAKTSVMLAVRSAIGIGESALFGGVTTDTLNDAEPSLTFVDASSPSTSFTVVSQTVIGDSVFFAAVRSTSGTCFMIRHQDAGSDFAKAAVPTCKAGDHGLMAFGPSW